MFRRECNSHNRNLNGPKVATLAASDDMEICNFNQLSDDAIRVGARQFYAFRVETSRVEIAFCLVSKIQESKLLFKNEIIKSGAMG